MKSSHPLSRFLRNFGSWRTTTARTIGATLVVALIATACGSDTDAESVGSDDVEETTTSEAAAETLDTTDGPLADPSTSVRDSGMTVTIQPAGDVVVHSLTAPEEVFANSTHIIETTNVLVVVDTQFLLPNAVDFRAYADGLGKPIDRVFITHDHPDHFLGSEAFADVPVYALDHVSAAIASNGQAEVDEKQGDFGPEAIASTYVVPEVVEAGTVEIDGVTFELTEVDNAEAEVQMVIRVPDHGVVVTGDLVYSGVHLILAGPADTWTVALNDLAADSDSYPIVLAGHGLPTDPTVYDVNIAWLATAGELVGTVDNAVDFKQGLIDAYPELAMSAAIDFVTPFLFPDSTEPAAAEEVAFGECAEVSTGTVTALAALQAELPDGVTALSLTAQGTVFDGSDDLGVLITRTLRCDEIIVGGASDGDGQQHIAHVGTPIDPSAFPGSPYNSDGDNGADFNNYIFGYYSDSALYVDALRAAGVTGAEVATITMSDVAAADCVVSRAITVGSGSFSFDATGDIPDAACEEPVVPFIANWWNVTDGSTAVASNNISGQAAIFIDTAATVVTIAPTGQGFQRVVGADPVTADAFGVIGLIPASDGSSMTITAAGDIVAPG